MWRRCVAGAWRLKSPVENNSWFPSATLVDLGMSRVNTLCSVEFMKIFCYADVCTIYLVGFGAFLSPPWVIINIFRSLIVFESFNRATNQGEKLMFCVN